VCTEVRTLIYTYNMGPPSPKCPPYTSPNSIARFLLEVKRHTGSKEGLTDLLVFDIIRDFRVLGYGTTDLAET